MSSLRAPALVGVVFALLFSGVTPPAYAEPTPRVCLTRIVDRTGRVSRRRTLSLVHRALRAEKGMRVVGRRAYFSAARRLRIRRRHMWRTASVRRVARRLRLQMVVEAHVERHGGAYRLLLEARQVGAKGELEAIAEGSARQRRPRFSWRTIRRAVRALARNLRRHKPKLPAWADQTAPDQTAPSDPVAAPKPADPPQATSKPTTPASKPATDDGWNMDASGFSEVKPEEERASLKIKQGGRIGVEHFSYFKDLGPDRVAGRNASELTLQIRAGTENFFGFGRFIGRYDFSEPARNRLDADEAYIEARLGRFKFRVGRMIDTWGAASLLNPVDVLNPVDYLDLVDREKRGGWMTRVSLLLGPVELSLYWLPVFQGHILPLPSGIADDGTPLGSSRWLPQSFGASTTFPLTYTLEQTQPRALPENFQGGLRLAASVAGLDLALSYAYLFDRMPTVRGRLQLRGLPPSSGEVTISFEHDRIHTLGLEAETAFGKLHLAAEALGVITENTDGKDDAIHRPYVVMVGGADYRSSEFFGEHRLHLFLELMHARALKGELFADPLRFPIETGLLSRIRYEIGEHLRFDFNVVSSLQEVGLALNPEIEVVIYDKIIFHLGGLFLLGDDESFFGAYRDNSRIQAKMELAF